jgi:hypothetical protein
MFTFERKEKQMGPTELWAMVSEILGTVSHNRRGDSRFEWEGNYSVWHVLKVILFGVVHRISIPSFYRKLKKPGFLRAPKLKTAEDSSR